MTGITHVTGAAYPLGAANVDTDAIIAADHLKTTERAGLGRHAFAAMRAGGDSVFDDPAFSDAPTIIAGDNFGCGSSREHAVWALADMGVSAVIAPSFSDIFAGNAFKNGVICVALPQPAIDTLLSRAREGTAVTVDLDTMTVTTTAQDRFPFTLDPFRRTCLMTGADEIAMTLAFADRIATYERAHSDAA